jgi:hypothetical protein
MAVYSRPDRAKPTAYTALPAEGSRRRPPTWPLGTVTEGERAMWGRLWHSPIAAHWWAAGIVPDVVARYVRLALEKPGAPALSAMENALALTPIAMARLHLKVEAEEERDAPEPVFEVIERARRRHGASA